MQRLRALRGPVQLQGPRHWCVQQHPSDAETPGDDGLRCPASGSARNPSPRMVAWLLSQTWAMNTAIKPKTTANPIMTMVWHARQLVPFDATELFFGLFVRTLEVMKY